MVNDWTLWNNWLSPTSYSQALDVKLGSERNNKPSPGHPELHPARRRPTGGGRPHMVGPTCLWLPPAMVDGVLRSIQCRAAIDAVL